jgi:alpha-L-fucosidase
MMRKKLLVLSILANLLACANVSAAPDSMDETAAQHDARMSWWRQARFGMFIHWGLYSQAAGEWDGKPTSGAGEWIMNDMQIPLSQYATLVPRFNPVQFDAAQWVRVAKDAGMKYIVITSKHHEGFGMYRSSLTDWCIASTPFARDPLKELAAACRAQGLTFCFYHSIMDWHNPEYAPRKPWNDIDKNPPDFDRYDAFLKGQLKELLTGYGRLGVLWFDGQWENTWTYERGADLYNYVRALQPNIIVNDRVGTGQALQPGQRRYGDYKTPEQTIPPNGFGPGVDWETCMTMNDTWGYKKSDQDWKSTETIVRNLIDCASKGGNYLLNVGPTGEGLIPDASIQRLAETGRWIKANSKAIYGTSASPFARQLPWGRCTQKTARGVTTLYLHVFQWPADGKLTVPGLRNKAKSASVLVTREKVAAVNIDSGLVLSLPLQAPDALSSTVILRLQGAPDIEATFILQDADGSVTLRASEAGLHGGTVQYEPGSDHDNIGCWTDASDWADWEFKLKEGGTFSVTAETAAQGSGSYEISVAGQTLRGEAPITGSYTKFVPVKLGTIDLSTPARIVLAVHPVKDGWQPMNLRAIRLEPISPKR